MLKPVLFCNYEGGEEKREGKGRKRGQEREVRERKGRG